MDKKCFVIMGFGKKTDYENGKTYDMDKTYQNLIKPAVLEAGYDCIRADEIQDSGLIDKSMYALLIKADLVIADISTSNPNALYELGIRHAVRPYATIIIKEDSGKIPFDINHNRIFMYKHLGEDLGFEEVKSKKRQLVSLIKEITSKNAPDSPMYEYINVTPPSITDEVYEQIITELANKENHIFAATESARINMNKSLFDEAFQDWGKANHLLPNENYYIQQMALCKYKSEKPSEQVALTDALQIISKISQDGQTNDPETLGLLGSINKRLYKSTKQVEYLDRAIESYGKGYKVRNDYYTGENYAFCLNVKSQITSDSDEKVYYMIEAKKTREKIVAYLETLEEEELSKRKDTKWIYASMSTCYSALSMNEKECEYENMFLAKKPADWEKKSFYETKNELEEILGKKIIQDE